MGFKKWCVAKVDKELAKELAYECDADPIVALIAASRGYTDPMELEEFLMDEPVFSDPTAMADIIIAAEIVNAAIEDGVKIAIYGDYDCDGVTATALLYNYLKTRKADCVYYIPNRFTEGYGMNCDAVKSLSQQGVGLIVTVDNGINAHEEIELARSLGMEVVVTDHHLPGDTLPNASAVVDPHRIDCPSEFKEICGVEVAFRLICVMENKEPEELLPYFADILCVGVLADVMPLTGENRSIVKYGVEKLKAAPITGLSALINVAGLEQKSLTSTKVTFGITPRINAAGRMGDAARAVELLTSDNMMTALGLANEIDADNTHRQQVERDIFKEAIERVENNGYHLDRVIVCEGEGWHHGVVGIVAAKITEKYGKPAILISVDEDGSAHGSGRSIEGFNLFDTINSAKEHLEKFGGHELAAGISIRKEKTEDFRKAVNAYALSKEPVSPVLHIDCRLNPSALNVDLALSLKALEPYGHGNSAPIFGIYGVELKRITPIGNGKHLRLLLSKGDTTFTALLFGVTPEGFCFGEGDIVDLAVSVEENYFKGELSVSVNTKAIRMSGTNDEDLFKGLFLYDELLDGKSRDYSFIYPTRDEVGAVYKFICQASCLADRVKYHFINSIGLGKTLVAIKALEELNLITDNKGVLTGIKAAKKTDLELSATYKKTMKGV